MPRYFFHSFNASEIVDDEGVEVADDETAKREAILLLAGHLHDDKGEFWGTRPWSLRVRDETGRVVAVYTVGAECPAID